MAAFEELCSAVRAGDAVRAAELLRTQEQLKGQLDRAVPGDGFGATPLLVAVQRRDRETAGVLLDAGASPDARSHWWAGGFGVLDWESGLEEYLIARGATVGVHAAARMGRVGRLKELLDRDPALVHARGGDGCTPLHFAANAEVAELLLARGAEIDAVDVDHESTPAQYMARDRREVARYLVSRGCRTDVLLAAALGDRDLVRRHLEARPQSVRWSVTREHFPMRGARAGGTIYIWTLGWFATAHLLAHDNRDAAMLDLLKERSPAAWNLAMACETGDEEGARRLRTAVSPAAEDAYRLPAAAHNNRTAAVRLLLEAGWAVETVGQGATALHWAAWHGNAEMVRALVERGAPPDVRDARFGATPAGWAQHGRENSWHRGTGDYAAVMAMLGRE